MLISGRLTNASPFIEDENQQNLRTRIIERTIDWMTLETRGVSDNCTCMMRSSRMPYSFLCHRPGYHFIQMLLQEDAAKRMSLTDALSHPWLQSYIPVFPVPQATVPRRGPRAGITHNMLGLQVRSGASLRTDGSLPAPLQRRSDILSQAAEGTRNVPQPSAEMIANANAMENKRGKRGRGNLAPLDEEEDSDDQGPSSSRNGGQGTATRSKRPRLRSEA